MSTPENNTPPRPNLDPQQARTPGGTPSGTPQIPRVRRRSPSILRVQSTGPTPMPLGSREIPWSQAIQDRLRIIRIRQESLRRQEEALRGEEMQLLEMLRSNSPLAHNVTTNALANSPSDNSPRRSPPPPPIITNTPPTTPQELSLIHI